VHLCGNQGDTQDNKCPVNTAISNTFIANARDDRCVYTYAEASLARALSHFWWQRQLSFYD
jgi:hypothetical protein